MNGDHFIWRTSADLLHVSTESNSFQCLIEGTAFDVSAEGLLGSYLWWTASSSVGDTLFAKFAVRDVSKMDEGPLVGRLLVTADRERSYYFHRPRETPMDWTLKASGLEKLAVDRVSELPLEMVRTLDDAVNAAIRRSVIPPKESILAAAMNKLHGLEDCPEKLARRLVNEFKMEYPVSDLVLNAGCPESWDVYETAAFFALRRRFEEDQVNSIIEFLAKERIAERLSATRRTDSLLVTVDPKKIHTRSYVGEGSYGVDFAKLDRAERKHQAILRDVSNRLVGLGMKPMESSSIDLAIEHRLGAWVVFEIKSATPENFNRQISKGTFQLIEYSFDLRQEGFKIADRVLLVERSGQLEPGARWDKMLRSVDITLLHYDESEDWPRRVQGLGDLLGVSSNLLAGPSGYR